MCPITINKALLLQEGILKFELSWTAVNIYAITVDTQIPPYYFSKSYQFIVDEKSIFYIFSAT